MATPKVSVIIPVYNAQTYLYESVKSVQNQTFSDIEIILVNDGSKDNSEKICRELSSEDKRIVLINKQNEGAGKARLTGIKEAKGEYVCFLDSDDLMDSTFVEKMYIAITEENADLVECGYFIFSDKIKTEHNVFTEKQVFQRETFLTEIVENTIIDGTEAIVLWNKMYKKAYLEEFVKIHTANILEDYLFNMQYYYGVEKYVYINECLVNYRIVGNSLSRSFHPELFDKFKEVMPIKEEYMDMFGLNGTRCKEKHARWYMRYILNYLKSGIDFPEFFKRTKIVLKDECTYKEAKLLTDDKLSKLIAKGYINAGVIYVYLAGTVFKIKKKLYKLKHR